MTTTPLQYAQADHFAVAAAARAERGAWFLASVYRTRDSACATARRLPAGQTFYAYAPAGSYEAYTAIHINGHALWVRYVAGDAPVPALHDTMTVRVTDRGDGPGYEGVCIVTVTVSALCRVCGGPRGVDTIRPNRIAEDGEYYYADVWDNPCGHTDMYRAVLAESRSAAPRQSARPASVLPPGVVDAGRFTDAVALLLAAAAERRIHHAAQAAQLLTDHEHPEAAAFVRAEIRAHNGQMSVKEAAYGLRNAGAPITDRKDVPA